MEWQFLGSVAAATVILTVPAHATVYLTVEQAQQALLPGIALTAFPLHLSDAQKAAIEKQSGVAMGKSAPRVWRGASGELFIVDEVIGKHEYITYAVALGGDGAVRGIEIMEYRESYGYEVRNAEWRHQFVGKTAKAALKLDGDIKNIGGATLSCRHVTDGVKRLLALYDVALK
ncbi:MAG TPA: FMN-binding protein [Stellaceae bacterium]|nr:FMN-binding protein [Stellaceae bacterium]